MEMDNIVKQLRILTSECSGEWMQLPSEMVAVISRGRDQIEESWEWVEVDEVLQYIADMLEE